MLSHRCSYYELQGICARIMMKNLSTASGQGVARASHGSMTASAMNNYIRITAHSFARVAGNRLQGLTPLIVIVRCLPQFAGLHRSD